MVGSPRLVYVIVVIQAIFTASDLVSPFLSGAFLNYEIGDFLMAYFMAILDFILLVGFLRGSKWAWFFGLIYNGFNILNHSLAFFGTQYLSYVILVLMRITVLFCLRSSSVRRYFGVTKVSR